jgi:hypothetical protein
LRNISTGSRSKLWLGNESVQQTIHHDFILWVYGITGGVGQTKFMKTERAGAVLSLRAERAEYVARFAAL